MITTDTTDTANINFSVFYILEEDSLLFNGSVVGVRYVSVIWNYDIQTKLKCP